MNLHLFVCILRLLGGFNVTNSQSWLNSSVGRALHRYRRGHNYDHLRFQHPYTTANVKLTINSVLANSLKRGEIIEGNFS